MIEKERTAYLDYLRVIASFLVVVLHISAQNWGITDIYSFNWKIMNIYDGVTRCAVPLFIMISGTIFIKKEISIKIVYSKYISRLIIAFLFWSTIYACIKGGSNKQIVGNIISGHYHLWFIPMIIGVYMAIPIIKIMDSNKVIMRYIIFWGFIFIFLLPEIFLLMNDFGGSNFQKLVISLEGNVTYMNFFYWGKYAYYFILGHYLDKIPVKKWMMYTNAFLGILGAIITISLTHISSMLNGHAIGSYYGIFTVNVLLESIGMYCFIKCCFESKDRDVIVHSISKCTFGIYLVHVLVIEQIALRFGINSLSFWIPISIPVLSLFVFLVSLITSYLLRQIPIINKYIV